MFDNARFHGEITDALAHEELEDVVLYKDGLGRKSYWAVDVPYGKIKGELNTPEGVREINGYTYQDRQWGNILIQEWVKNWTWAQLANDNLFVVIFGINNTEGTTSWHSISGHGNEISLSQKFKAPHLAKLAITESPDSATIDAEIKIPGKLSVAFTLSPQNLMRSRVKERHPGFTASYVRWAVDGTIERPKEIVQGVAEYMNIQKNDS